jgi:hypothetical protein
MSIRNRALSVSHGLAIATIAGAPFVFSPPPVAAQLGVAGAQILQQGEGGLPGPAEAQDRFGSSVAAGDFDGDGYVDLAIGAPLESVSPASTNGAVVVVMGSAAGLDGSTGLFWTLDGPDGEQPGTGDNYGAALAVGDFDLDGFDDLAVGIPGRAVQAADLSIQESAGAVEVIYGSATGLQDSGRQLWRQGASAVIGAPEESDGFGSSLSAGDFDGDGFADLAVGVPGESVDDVEDAGAVNVLYGSTVGLSTTFLSPDNQIWTQGDLGSSGDESGDRFGDDLAAGDFDGDGRDDLAVGAPNEDYNAVGDAGALFVLLGAADGLSALGDQIFWQEDAGISDNSEAGDKFGGALAAGDFDGDGVADLAVGSPGENHDAIPDEAHLGGTSEYGGMVHVLPGVVDLGLSSVAAATLHRGELGGADASFIYFGDALAAGRFGSGGISLVVGAHGAPVEELLGAGEAHVVTGPDLDEPSATQVWSQAGSVPGAVEGYDRFGSALAIGDFDGNGFDDLAVGVPLEGLPDVAAVGVVNVLYSQALFRDGFERYETGRWSSATP